MANTGDCWQICLVIDSVGEIGEEVGSLVGGLEHEFYFPYIIYWGCHPSQPTNSHIFQRGRRKTTNQVHFIGFVNISKYPLVI